MENIKNYLNEQFAKLSSMTVTEENGNIVINVAKYRGNTNTASAAQVDFIKDLYDYQSSSNLRKLNKFAASALIRVGKELQKMGETVYVHCI